MQQSCTALGAPVHPLACSARLMVGCSCSKEAATPLVMDSALVSKGEPCKRLCTCTATQRASAQRVRPTPLVMDSAFVSKGKPRRRLCTFAATATEDKPYACSLRKGACPAPPSTFSFQVHSKSEQLPRPEASQRQNRMTQRLQAYNKSSVEPQLCARSLVRPLLAS
eukprot:1159841-Pelagomonas_calceolata.AAC.7